MYANPNYGGGNLHHSASVSSRRGYTPSYTNQSGYSYSPGPPAPAGSEPQLWQWFSAVDTDRSGSISVNELQAALVNGQLLSYLFFVQLTNIIVTGNWSSELSRIAYFFYGPPFSPTLLTPLNPDFDLDTVKMLMNMFVSYPHIHHIEGYLANVGAHRLGHGSKRNHRFCWCVSLDFGRGILWPTDQQSSLGFGSTSVTGKGFFATLTGTDRVPLMVTNYRRLSGPSGTTLHHPS